MRELSGWIGVALIIGLYADFALFMMGRRQPVGRGGYIALHVILVLSAVLVVWGFSA